MTLILTTILTTTRARILPMRLTSRVAGADPLRRVFAIARLFQLKIGSVREVPPTGFEPVPPP